MLDDVLVENCARMVTVDHRTYPQLRLAWRSQLSNYDYIEQRVQRVGNFLGDGDTAARNTENDEIAGARKTSAAVRAFVEPLHGLDRRLTAVPADRR